jgi:hypothetical protein
MEVARAEFSRRSSPRAEASDRVSRRNNREILMISSRSIGDVFGKKKKKKINSVVFLVISD